MERREKPPEIEIAPMEVKGWVVRMRVLHHAERNPGDLSAWGEDSPKHSQWERAGSWRAEPAEVEDSLPLGES